MIVNEKIIQEFVHCLENYYENEYVFWNCAEFVDDRAVLVLMVKILLKNDDLRRRFIQELKKVVSGG